MILYEETITEIYLLKGDYKANRIDPESEGAISILFEKLKQYGATSRKKLFDTRKQGLGVDPNIDGYEPVSFDRRNNGGDSWEYTVTYKVKDKKQLIDSLWDRLVKLENSMTGAEFANYLMIRSGVNNYSPTSPKPEQQCAVLYYSLQRLGAFDQPQSN